MLAILTVLLGLAAVFGFLLGIYVFSYRVNLPQPLRWLGGIVGGLVTACVMVGLILLIIWPPLSIPFIIGGLGFVGIVSVAALMGGNKKGNGQKNGEVLLGTSDVSQNRSGLNDGLDAYGLDLDVGTGS